MHIKDKTAKANTATKPKQRRLLRTETIFKHFVRTQNVFFFFLHVLTDRFILTIFNHTFA